MSELAYELKAKLKQVKDRIKRFVDNIEGQVKSIKDEIQDLARTVTQELTSIPAEIMTVKTTLEDEIKSTIAKAASLDPSSISGPSAHFEKLINHINTFSQFCEDQGVGVMDDLAGIDDTLKAEIDSIPPEIDSIRKEVILQLDDLLKEVEAMVTG